MRDRLADEYNGVLIDAEDLRFLYQGKPITGNFQFTGSQTTLRAIYFHRAVFCKIVNSSANLPPFLISDSDIKYVLPYLLELFNTEPTAKLTFDTIRFHDIETEEIMLSPDQPAKVFTRLKDPHAQSVWKHVFTVETINGTLSINMDNSDAPYTAYRRPWVGSFDNESLPRHIEDEINKFLYGNTTLSTGSSTRNIKKHLNDLKNHLKSIKELSLSDGAKFRDECTQFQNAIDEISRGLTLSMIRRDIIPLWEKLIEARNTLCKKTGYSKYNKLSYQIIEGFRVLLSINGGLVYPNSRVYKQPTRVQPKDYSYDKLTREQQNKVCYHLANFYGEISPAVIKEKWNSIPNLDQQGILNNSQSAQTVLSAMNARSEEVDRPQPLLTPHKNYMAIGKSAEPFAITTSEASSKIPKEQVQSVSSDLVKKRTPHDINTNNIKPIKNALSLSLNELSDLEQILLLTPAQLSHCVAEKLDIQLLNNVKAMALFIRSTPKVSNNILPQEQLKLKELLIALRNAMRTEGSLTSYNIGEVRAKLNVFKQSLINTINERYSLGWFSSDEARRNAFAPEKTALESFSAIIEKIITPPVASQTLLVTEARNKEIDSSQPALSPGFFPKEISEASDKSVESWMGANFEPSSEIKDESVVVTNAGAITLLNLKLSSLRLQNTLNNSIESFFNFLIKNAEDLPPNDKLAEVVDFNSVIDSVIYLDQENAAKLVTAFKALFNCLGGQNFYSILGGTLALFNEADQAINFLHYFIENSGGINKYYEMLSFEDINTTSANENFVALGNSQFQTIFTDCLYEYCDHYNVSLNLPEIPEPKTKVHSIDYISPAKEDSISANTNRFGIFINPQIAKKKPNFIAQVMDFFRERHANNKNVQRHDSVYEL